MKKKFYDHMGLKLLSLVIAFVMWFIVMNIEDSTIARTISGIPVKMLNENTILDSGNVFDVTSGDTVDVIVKGPRSIVENLEVDNFTAVADLSQLSVTNSTTISVNVNSSVSIKKMKMLTITPINEYVTLSIESEVEKSVPVKVITTGTVMNGYSLGNAVPAPNMITVKGPASVLANIVEARAVVDVNQATKNIKSKINVGCIDGYGAAIAKDNISLSTETVEVSIPVYKTKEIPVNVKIAGSPKEGYAVKEVNFEPNTIVVAGPSSELKNIESLDILDVVVTDATENIEKNKNVSEYLPNNIILADPASEEIAISVTVEKLEEREISLNAANISITDTSKDYKYSITSPVVLKVKIKGFPESIDSVDAKALSARISADNLSLGSHVLQVKFEEKSSFSISGNYSVTLEVEEAK